jgi:hypothetical protein
MQRITLALSGGVDRSLSQLAGCALAGAPLLLPVRGFVREPPYNTQITAIRECPPPRERWCELGNIGRHFGVDYYLFQ